MAKPESPIGFSYADYVPRNVKERMERIYGRIGKIRPAATHLLQRMSVNIQTAVSVFLQQKKCTMVHVYLLNKQQQYSAPVFYEAGENLPAQVLPGFTMAVNDKFKN